MWNPQDLINLAPMKTNCYYWCSVQPVQPSSQMGAVVTLSTDIMLEYIFLRIHKVSSNGKQSMHATLYHITGLFA